MQLRMKSTRGALLRQSLWLAQRKLFVLNSKSLELCNYTQSQIVHTRFKYVIGILWSPLRCSHWKIDFIAVVSIAIRVLPVLRQWHANQYIKKQTIELKLFVGKLRWPANSAYRPNEMEKETCSRRSDSSHINVWYVDADGIHWLLLRHG